jgi:hypothetical protein
MTKMGIVVWTMWRSLVVCFRTLRSPLRRLSLRDPAKGDRRFDYHIHIVIVRSDGRPVEDEYLIGWQERLGCGADIGRWKRGWFDVPANRRDV